MGGLFHGFHGDLVNNACILSKFEVRGVCRTLEPPWIRNCSTKGLWIQYFCCPHGWGRDPASRLVTMFVWIAPVNSWGLIHPSLSTWWYAAGMWKDLPKCNAQIFINLKLCSKPTCSQSVSCSFHSSCINPLMFADLLDKSRLDQGHFLI